MLRPLVAVAFSAIACQNEGQQIPPQQKVTIEASTGVLTRTSLGNDGAVLWSAGDSFELNNPADLTGSSYSVFTLVSGAGESTASFEGVLPEGDAFVGVYGNRVSSFNDNGDPNTVGIMLEPVQPYADASFASKYNPMVAYFEPSAGNTVMFRNVCGLVEFRITGIGTLQELRISSGDKVMSGVMEVHVTRDDVAIQGMTELTGSFISVNGINAELSTDTPLSVYCVLSPGTYEGFTVIMTDTEGNTVTKNTTDVITVERAVVTPVEGLVFDNTVAPAIEVSVDETLSDCFVTYINIALTGSQDADGFMYLAGSSEEMDMWMSTNDPIQLLLEYGDYVDQTSTVQKWNFYPETQISMAVLAVKGKEPVGNVVRRDFDVPAIPIDETLDVTATVDVTGGVANVTVNFSGDAIALYSGLWFGGVLDGLSDAEIASHLVALCPAVDVTGNVMYSYQVSDIPEGIKLDVFAMVKSENGYSNVSKDMLYVPIEPGEDTWEYRRFIGEWSVSGDDVAPFTVTVAEDVVGKTYRVSGLANYYPGEFDDTIIAKFDGANIYFETGTHTAEIFPEYSYAYFQAYVYNIEADGWDRIYQLTGMYSNGQVVFGNGDGNYAYEIRSNTEDAAFGSCRNMVWSSGAGNNASTEGFGNGTPVNPGWK